MEQESHVLRIYPNGHSKCLQLHLTEDVDADPAGGLPVLSDPAVKDSNRLQIAKPPA